MCVMMFYMYLPHDRDGLNELYAATRKQLNSEMELRQVENIKLYVIVKALPMLVCMKNTARGGVSRG